MVLLHQADVMYMQNWEHVDFVMRLANKLPSTSHETDFSRVRQYFLDGKAAQHRQLLLTSAFNTPELQAFYREYASSKHGQLRFKRHHGDGCIGKVVINVKQVFQRIPGIKSFTSQEDTRFGYFKEQVLAPLLRLQQSHTLIITPSYFDFVRVRNELLHQEANAAYICEYSRDSEISRGRSRFYHGTKHILLYSGRAHFFRYVMQYD
jgi:U3 small nucleolar RNA-associated protein 25